VPYKAKRDLRVGGPAVRLEHQPRCLRFCCAKPNPAAIGIDSRNISEPDCFRLSDNRHDVGHVARTEASAYGQLDALEQTTLSPFLL
jgi:hypothetical protein